VLGAPTFAEASTGGYSPTKDPSMVVYPAEVATSIHAEVAYNPTTDQW
jgi:hypothetical protein